MLWPAPHTTRTYTLFPCTTLFLSSRALRLSLPLRMGLDQPEVLVCAARDLGEEVGGDLVAHLRRRVDRRPYRLAESSERGGKRLDVSGTVSDVEWIDRKSTRLNSSH